MLTKADDKRRFLFLALLMLAACLLVGAIAISAMYQVAFQQKRTALLDSVQSQAGLVRHLLAGRRLSDPLGAVAEVLFRFEGHGRTGEFVVVRPVPDGTLDRLVVRHPQGSPQPSLERTVWARERLGEPMRLALSGQSGTTIGIDYRGIKVLAAYAQVPELGYGLVAKMDLEEVRAPILVAASYTLVAAVFVVLMASALFIALSAPLLRRMEAGKARLAGIVSTAVEGIVTADAQGAIVELNDAAVRMFGIDAASARGMPVEQLFSAASRAAYRSGIERFRTSGDGFVVGQRSELVGLHRDGSCFPIEVAVSVTEVQGQQFITSFIHDIAARREAEQALRKANEVLEQRVADRTSALAQSNRILRAVSAVQTSFIDAGAPGEAYRQMLEQVMALTDSRAGYLVDVDEAPHLVLSIGVTSEPRPEHWGPALSGGAPCHYALDGQAWMVMPLEHGDQVVALLGLGGRAEAYPPDFLEVLRPAVQACAHLLAQAHKEAERTTARQQLLDYERELNNILLNVQDVIFRTDREGRITWASPSVYEVSGFGLEEVIGSPFSRFTEHPDDYLRLHEALAGHGGRIRNFELLMRRYAGDFMTISANCQYHYDESGQIAGLEGVVRDITQAKLAEQRIESLNRLYSVLSEVNKAVVRQHDRERLFEQVCRIVVEQGGLCMAWIGVLKDGRVEPVVSAGAVSGYLDDFAVDMDDRDHRSGPVAGALLGGGRVVCHDIATDPRMAPWREGALARGYRSSASFPFLERDNLVGTFNLYAPVKGFFTPEVVELLQSLATDIGYALNVLCQEAERNVFLEELRQLSEKLSLHVRNTPLAVIEFDTEFRIRRWNRSAERIFGYGAGEVIGQPASLILPPSLRDEAATAYARLLKNEGGWEIVSENLTADGRVITCEWYNTTLTDADGAVIGVMSQAHDITEVVRSRDEILSLNASLERRVAERTRELERVNRELEAFSYSVSHDLRAPLRIVDGFGDLLLKRYGDALDETARGYLRRVRGASQRMGQLIDDLLNLSRVMRAELRRAPVDLSALAQVVVDDLRQCEPERLVEVRIAEKLNAFGDDRLLHIVLTNLLGNAWKFTGRSAQPRIEFGLERQGNEAVFFVRDNGAGFDMRYADKLFGAFQRLHSNDEFEGTGIGLATVQRIIHRHGGRIWTSAAPGEGACFFFTLEQPMSELGSAIDGT